MKKKKFGLLINHYQKKHNMTKFLFKKILTIENK